MAVVVCEKSAHFKCTHKSALSIPGIPTVFTSYSSDSHHIYTVFVGFPPCLHHIRGIPTVYTSDSSDSHRVYIVFAGFPPYLHHIRGIPIVFTSYSRDSHRIYIIFVWFWIPGIRRSPLDKYVYAWYSSLYFSVIGLLMVEGCLLIFYGQSLYVGQLH